MHDESANFREIFATQRVSAASLFPNPRHGSAGLFKFPDIGLYVADPNQCRMNDRVVEEIERVLARPLTPDELRLLLLARIIEEEVLEGKDAFLQAG